MKPIRIRRLAPWVVLSVVLSSEMASWGAEIEANTLDPAAETAFYDGNARLGVGDAAGALVAFDRALVIAPDFYRVHLYRARAFIALGNAGGALEALGVFESRASTDAERNEAEQLRDEVGQLAEPIPPDAPAAGEDDGPAAPGAAERPAAYVGIEGGYALTRQDSTWHWGLVQLRVDVRLWRGLAARAQVGLGLHAAEDVLYGVVPAALGITWRANVRPRPYLDVHVLVVAYNDGKAADGSALEGATRSLGVGGGVGSGIEIDLVRKSRFGLSLAPQVQVGWAGVFLVQGGVSLRAAFGGGAQQRGSGS